MSGWVKLPRSTEDHPTLRNATRRGLFDRLYLMAARQPTTKDWRGTTVALDVAQVVISVREFADQNDVGYKEARNHLARLKRDRLIKIGTVKGAVRGAKEGAIGTLVTICLDELFSASDEVPGAGKGAMNGAVTGAIGAQEGRNRGAPVLETLEKGEKEEITPHTPPQGGAEPPKPKRRARKREDDPEGFKEFYGAYPRKVAPDAAAKAYAKARARSTREQILSGLMDAKAEWGQLGTKRELIPHPATWLNGGRWRDEHLPGRPAKPGQSSVAQRAREMRAARRGYDA